MVQKGEDVALRLFYLPWRIEALSGEYDPTTWPTAWAESWVAAVRAYKQGFVPTESYPGCGTDFAVLNSDMRTPEKRLGPSMNRFSTLNKGGAAWN